MNCPECGEAFDTVFATVQCQFPVEGFEGDNVQLGKPYIVPLDDGFEDATAHCAQCGVEFTLTLNVELV